VQRLRRSESEFPYFDQRTECDDFKPCQKTEVLSQSCASGIRVRPSAAEMRITGAQLILQSSQAQPCFIFITLQSPSRTKQNSNASSGKPAVADEAIKLGGFWVHRCRTLFVRLYASVR